MSGEAHIRPAVKDDCRSIAELVAIASDGLAEYIWGKDALEGESLIDVGTRRYARENEDFSYQNTTVIEFGGVIAGMALCYAMPPSQDRDLDQVDPVMRPYAQLEDPGSLYISDIALFTAFRGIGLGSRLLADIHAKARSLGFAKTSLICFEENTTAMRLYKRLDYVQIDSHPIVPHPCLKHLDGDAILLRRETRQR